MCVAAAPLRSTWRLLQTARKYEARLERIEQRQAKLVGQNRTLKKQLRTARSSNSMNGAASVSGTATPSTAAMTPATTTTTSDANGGGTGVRRRLASALSSEPGAMAAAARGLQSAGSAASGLSALSEDVSASHSDFVAKMNRGNRLCVGKMNLRSMLNYYTFCFALSPTVRQQLSLTGTPAALLSASQRPAAAAQASASARTTSSQREALHRVASGASQRRDALLAARSQVRVRNYAYPDEQ